MSSNRSHKMRISAIRRADRGRCKNKTVEWGTLCDKLRDVQVDKQHTQLQYNALSIDDKNNAKDVGSYVLGHFKNNVRKAQNVEMRDGVALDIDSASFEHIDYLRMGLSEVSKYEFAAVTSRSHTITQPKYRLVFPIHKPMPADYYAAVSRILASMLFATVAESMEATDDVSYRVAQIMYWPSMSKDGRFDFFLNEGQVLDWESLLAAYPGWDDYTQLPYAETRGIVRPGQKGPAERPYDKRWLVGAFCRAYSVPQAIERFIPDIYVRPQKEGKKVRYTYAKGHGSKGAIVEDDGLFLYSHHGTDPCGERLVNAFDMVRLHLYGHEDARKADDASPTQLPSFKAMIGFLADDPQTRAESRRMADERIDAQFESLDEDDTPLSASDFDPLADDDIASLLGDAPAKAVEPDDEIDEILGTAKVRPGDPDADGEAPRYVQRMNAKHAVADIDGKVMVMNLKEDKTVTFSNRESFILKYANERVPKPGSQGDWSIAEAWLQHPQRDTYDGVVFDPDDTPPRHYNFWQGFTVEPKPKALCERFLTHLRTVICNNDKESYEYLIGWMAHMIQKPGTKPGVAVVMRGVKGAGKDTFGEYMGSLLRNYHVNTSDPDQIYGKFNHHLQRCLFLHVEEGFWAGNKQAEAALKKMVTSPRQMIEPKGVNAFQVKSCMRLFISSNEDWVVPASPDERRYFVLNVPNTRKGDTAYFDALYAEMNGDGPAALLAYLQAYDLSSFNVRGVPDTDGLRDQKETSLRSFELYWLTMLRKGELPVPDALVDESEADNRNLDWSAGEIRISCDILRESYRNWMKVERRFDGNPKNEKQIGIALHAMCPKTETFRPRTAGPARPRFYVFPSLGTCREAFSIFMSSKIEWESDATDQPEDVRFL